MVRCLRPLLLLLLAWLVAGLFLAAAAPVRGQSNPCTEVTLAEVQGAGRASPLAGAQRALCTTACVTGVAAEGFFVQSVSPDGNPDSSEAAYVFRYSSWQNPRQLRAGQLVHISGFRVQEFYGQTEIVGLANDKAASYQVVGACELPAPASIAAPPDPRADPETLYERYEGMQVTLAVDGSVTGPTQRYVSRFPAGDPEITFVDRASPYFGRLIPAGDVPGNRLTLALSGGLGVDLPDAGARDRIRAERVTGILAFQFGRYTVLVDDPSVLRVEKAALPPAPRVESRPDQFAICTYNVENLFDHIDDRDGDAGDWAPADAQAYARTIAGQAGLIRDYLAGCSVIGLQEVEGKDAVWEALARAVGPQYRYDYLESQDTRDITVGLLYDASRVEVWRSEAAQACTARDYGVVEATAVGPRAAGVACPPGRFPLFDRAPYVADLAVRSGQGERTADVRVIVVHLKSKRGEETENEPRRVLQARHVASLMTSRLSAAIGDLNDTLGSPALAQFGPAVNLFERHAARADRYSYIYQGRTEAIDHVLMTPELDRYLVRGGPIHVNADLPDARSQAGPAGRRSDHDPLFAQFAFAPTGLTEALHGAIGGLASPR